MRNTSGIIARNVLNMHKDPSTDSEMITQGIMGQPVRIIEAKDDWFYLETWDSYRAWALSRWISTGTPPRQTSIVNSLFADAFTQPCPHSEIITKLVISTELNVIDIRGRYSCIMLPDKQLAWISNEDISPGHAQSIFPSADTGINLIKTARRFIGVPYLWGGSTPFGIDCSGFTQLVYKLNGFTLPRDSGLQADVQNASSVDKDCLAAGDLIFFTGEKSRDRIIHVGIACGDGRFIHSLGKGTGVTINILSDKPFGSMYHCSRRIISY